MDDGGRRDDVIIGLFSKMDKLTNLISQSPGTIGGVCKLGRDLGLFVFPASAGGGDVHEVAVFGDGAAGEGEAGFA